jgi:hypothetical protein
MTTSIDVEGGVLHHRMNVVVIGELCYKEPFVPIILLFVYEHVKILFELFGSCGSCIQSKSVYQPPRGKLHSLLTSMRPWESIGMDFIRVFLDFVLKSRPPIPMLDVL